MSKCAIVDLRSAGALTDTDVSRAKFCKIIRERAVCKSCQAVEYQQRSRVLPEVSVKSTIRNEYSICVTENGVSFGAVIKQKIFAAF